MTQNTSSQCLPASRFRSELELRRGRGSLSHKSDYLSVACQSSNWHPELYSNTKGFPPDFFSHSMKSLFLHQHLKLVTRAFDKTSGRCCPPKKQMNKWVAGRAVDLESAGLGKLFDFSVPLLSSSGKWDSWQYSATRLLWGLNETMPVKLRIAFGSINVSYSCYRHTLEILQIWLCSTIIKQILQ